MKKLVFVIFLFFVSSNLYTQPITLTFTGRNSETNEFVKLSRIVITNNTRQWTKTLIYPDTAAEFLFFSKIEDFGSIGTFCLSPNVPNPFSGSTEVALNMPRQGKTTFKITDMIGRSIVSSQDFSFIQPGIQYFKITLSTPGIYILTAMHNGYISSIKMVNNGRGVSNSIECIGNQNRADNRFKGVIESEVAEGDDMTYQGYALIDGDELESILEKQEFSVSKSINLNFNIRHIEHCGTLIDVDGNTYSTVKIGTQCWMKENLRTTKYADGKEIAYGNCPSFDTAYLYMPDNNRNNVKTYGYLYNWAAVMKDAMDSKANSSGVQGVCPKGWHVPSDAEWTQLIEYVKSQSQYQCAGEESIAKAISSTQGWESSENQCGVGNDIYSNNSTGFSALPAGFYYDRYNNFGSNAYFWTATKVTNENVNLRYLNNNNSDVFGVCNNRSNGYSVRCLCDNENHAMVTTGTVSEIRKDAATCGGTVTYDGAGSIITKGVCWSYKQHPTVSNDHTVDGHGPGSFTSKIVGLTQNTTYYVRAYAISNIDTVYGEQREFKTKVYCPTTVSDRDGNSYKTVLIGEQCWMKENLRTTKFADGSEIDFGNDYSLEVAYRYYPNNDIDNVKTYGYLYNWLAVMHGSMLTDENQSGVQGICPDGWHVPSYTEWKQLTNYVGSQRQYWCSGNEKYIAKALASSLGWRYYSDKCVVGNTTSNNGTGFSALPAGNYNPDSFSSFFHYDAYFWMASDSIYIRSLWLDADLPDVKNLLTSRSSGLSVRCLYDNGIIVKTNEISNISYSSASCSGEVSYNSLDAIIGRGVCWSVAENPTVFDNKTIDGGGVGDFTSKITGLKPCTTYYVRAYAMSNSDTVYGEQKRFTTLVFCPINTVDIDGNIYSTVQIGEQCWMKENLRTVHYADGKEIPVISFDQQSDFKQSEEIAYCYIPNDDYSNVSIYGYLYNWPAVMNNLQSSETNPSGVQGICPNGWHVPSDAEWIQLTDFVSSQSQNRCNDDKSFIAKSLTAITGWNSSETLCCVGNSPNDNNVTGFSALPAGEFLGRVGSFGNHVAFWSATIGTSDSVYERSFHYDDATVNRGCARKFSGFSVRCLRDYGRWIEDLPTVTTNVATDVTSSSAICGGLVSDEGCSAVFERGICWNTVDNPTVTDNKTIIGSGRGEFANTIMDLVPHTTYYVRAYAINSIGIIYGETISFTTAQYCPNMPTVKDIDGNVYNTIQIGEQCWMKENLRVTRYADGKDIALGTKRSKDMALRYYPNGDSNSVKLHGYLYNWNAVMNTASSSETNPSGVQGVCPDGWHVPSDAEWTQLTDFVNSQFQYRSNGFDNYIAKSLASTIEWSSSKFYNNVGKDISTNNSTGFSVVPSGDYRGFYYGFRKRAFFWTTTQNAENYAYNRYLYSEKPNVGRYGHYLYDGCSVRCLKDIE